MRTDETVFVKSYNERDDSHRCERSDGTIIFVDFFVSGNLKDETNQSLIGRKFRISGHDYCIIADHISEEIL